MVSNKLVKTKNIAKAERCLGYLLGRPRSEMVGLGLIYGAPGLGKTRWAQKTALANNYIYLKLQSTSSGKNFCVKLLERLDFYLQLGGVNLRGQTGTLFARIVDVLNKHPEAVIVIDEVDYAFGNSRLLGLIRDMVDESFATVLLVGMQDAKRALLRANAHYFDRCNYFCEFESLGKDDVKRVLSEVCEVELDAAAMNIVHKQTGGTLRKLVKAVYLCENIAKQGKLELITAKELS